MAGDTFYITGDPDADGLLARDPLALLIGMLLDQQVPMEWAFASPARLAERLGGRLDAREIAAAVAFLASPEASYVTGSSMVIDGGLLLMAAVRNADSS
ncbi:MAG: SDR family oxidoreductase [Actinobacteria bacterium]|nr:SDR family oxidoreductase [Actinomycetota bacterium]